MKRLFSFTIIIIAALIFWGSQIWEKKKDISSLASSDPHYVDIFIRDFTITTMNDDGKPAYILKAKLLEHYNDSNYAIIDKPDIQLTEGNHRWRITANNGEIDDTNQRITLRGEVVLLQQDEQQPLQLETEKLEIDIRQQTAKSTQTVRIIQQGFNLQSEGMILNNATGKIELLNNVKGSHAQTP